jgi:hypothetical protein
MSVRATAKVIPFPTARRRHFVARQAERMADLSRDAGERHLAQQIKVQRDAMTRKGIERDVIEREMLALERAIRSALWGAIMTPGDVG